MWSGILHSQVCSNSERAKSYFSHIDKMKKTEEKKKGFKQSGLAFKWPDCTS